MSDYDSILAERNPGSRLLAGVHAIASLGRGRLVPASGMVLSCGRGQPVLDDAAIDGLNRGYVCPPGAGLARGL